MIYNSIFIGATLRELWWRKEIAFFLPSGLVTPLNHLQQCAQHKIRSFLVVLGPNDSPHQVSAKSVTGQEHPPSLSQKTTLNYRFTVNKIWSFNSIILQPYLIPSGDTFFALFLCLLPICSEHEHRDILCRRIPGYTVSAT